MANKLRKDGCLMSLDGAFLHIVKTEMINNGLIGGRIDKIHQPSKDEIVLSIRAGGALKKLIFSANPMQARVHLTDNTPENPKAPPMFCMLLRKHLGGGRLTDIFQDGFERILDFRFECVNEMGDVVTNRLVIEIMGRSSNIMLLGMKNGDWRVIDSLKRVTDEISSVRRILPNIIYESPPKQNRLSLLDFTPDELEQALSKHGNERMTKALLGIFEGIAPIFARECIYFATRDLDISVNALDKNGRERLLFFLKKSRDVIIGGGKPVIVSEKSGKPIDFCFVNIEQYGTNYIVSEYASANSLLDKFYSGRAEAERSKQRAGYLLKLLMNAYERVSRKLALQKEELLQCKKRDELKLYGDIINSHIYEIQKGAEVLVTDNYLTGEQVTIKLDPKLSAVQNSQKYYSEYKKLSTAEKMLTKLIADGEKELLYIDSVFDAASRAVSDNELFEIKSELAETGYLKSRGGKEKQPKALPPIHLRASDGTDIYVGRNNKQNDKLTLKTADAHDIWLHTKSIAGSHVIIKTSGGTPSEETLTEAAIAAAYCSKARGSSGVPVDYTLVRYVKKPSGAKPGMVIFTNNKTLYVTPDEEIYKNMQNINKETT